MVPYFLYDVFTLNPGGGGPLAVVDCREEDVDLNGIDMQKVSKEFGLPETTFILDPVNKNNLAKVKIFTPVMELPMAGHPVIGTSIHLATTSTNDSDFILELGVGDTRIEIENGDNFKAFMHQQPCQSHKTNVSTGDLANAFSISSSDIELTSIEVFSAGLAFIIVPIKSKEALYSMVPNRELIAKACISENNPRLYAFSFDEINPSLVHARMFNPDPGDGLEDPATGSAAGALIHFINSHFPVVVEANKSLTISQGVTLGRPSEINVSLVENAEGKYVPRVGGNAVLTGQGML